MQSSSPTVHKHLSDRLGLNGRLSRMIAEYVDSAMSDSTSAWNATRQITLAFFDDLCGPGSSDYDRRVHHSVGSNCEAVHKAVHDDGHNHSYRHSRSAKENLDYFDQRLWLEATVVLTQA